MKAKHLHKENKIHTLKTKLRGQKYFQPIYYKNNCGLQIMNSWEQRTPFYSINNDFLKAKIINCFINQFIIALHNCLRNILIPQFVFSKSNTDIWVASEYCHITQTPHRKQTTPGKVSESTVRAVGSSLYYRAFSWNNHRVSWLS